MQAMESDRYHWALPDTSTMFWGAVIFLAVFVSCFFAWKAIERLRNRRKFDGVAVEAGQIKDPRFAGSFGRYMAVGSSD
jgi:hypothetical protein